MMYLCNIANNCNELNLEDKKGLVRILFSYKTPVAAFINGQGFFIVEDSPSSTTSRHIGKWLSMYHMSKKDPKVQSKPEEFFIKLVKIK